MLQDLLKSHKQFRNLDEMVVLLIWEEEVVVEEKMPPIRRGSTLQSVAGVPLNQCLKPLKRVFADPLVLLGSAGMAGFEVKLGRKLPRCPVSRPADQEAIRRGRSFYPPYPPPPSAKSSV
jgi:hypothetical protein